jgi:hypothetical protein
LIRHRLEQSAFRSLKLPTKVTFDAQKRAASTARWQGRRHTGFAHGRHVEARLLMGPASKKKLGPFAHSPPFVSICPRAQNSPRRTVDPRSRGAQKHRYQIDGLAAGIATTPLTSPPSTRLPLPPGIARGGQRRGLAVALARNAFAWGAYSPCVPFRTPIGSKDRRPLRKRAGAARIFNTISSSQGM